MWNEFPRKKAISEINVVPYVDVMLVLLVIFMITAPIINQGVEVDLPSAQAKALPKDEPLPIIVSVNKKGELYLNTSLAPSSPIHKDKLKTDIADAIKNNPKRMVIVKADKQVSYEQVVQTMVLLQQAGVPSVGLETSSNES